MKPIAGMIVNKSRCHTCPFNDDGCIEVRNKVQQRVLTEASQMCHGTGIERFAVARETSRFRRSMIYAGLYCCKVYDGGIDALWMDPEEAWRISGEWRKWGNL